MTSEPNISVTAVRRAAWIVAGLALPLIIYLHLLPALLAGLLIYQLVHLTAPFLAGRIVDRRAKVAAVALYVILLISVIAVGALLATHYFRSEAGSLPALATRMAEILENSRATLPDWLVAWLPASPEALREEAAHWLRQHSSELQLVGKEAARTLAHVLIGLIIGAMLAVREAVAITAMPPLAAELAERARRLADAFRRIVFAQVRISAVNTILTGLYLAVILPMLGIHLPLTKTMIVITFVVGLLPVVGNLISNTVIFIVSLAYSPQVALASLAFLVIVHKLEYFLNARIVGGQISAKAWELLLAMLTLEAAFGLPGVVAAPIYYAYLKDELRSVGLV